MMASVAPPPMGGLDYARIGVVFLGAVLSIIGGATPWIVSSSGGSTTSIGLLSSCASGGGVALCVATNSTGLLAGGALLIIGFSKFQLRQIFRTPFPSHDLPPPPLRTFIF